MSPSRLLFVHAHPDDESLWTGGTLARHMARGGEAHLVLSTWAPGTTRHTEFLAAVRELGLTSEPISLGYADDHVPESAPDARRFCDVPFDEPVRTLTAHIRRLRPDAIVTYDANGIYGHPDHVHAHRVAAAAADAAADPHLYAADGTPWQVRSLYFVTTPEWMVEAVLGDVFADTPRRFLPGTPDADIDLTLDVSTWHDAKLAAIEAHRTEVRRSRSLQAMLGMPPDRRRRLLSTECFLRRDLVPGGHDI